MTRAEMVALLERIRKLLTELLAAELGGEGEPDPADLPRTGAPADEADIRRLEKELGVALPPSYRMFLSIHDGWRNWFGPKHLLSIAERRTPEWKQRIDRWQRRMWTAGEGGGVQGIVAAAPEGAQSWVYLDASSVAKDGEMETVAVDNIEELHRWSDFADYLAGTEKEIETAIRSFRRAKKR